MTVVKLISPLVIITLKSYFLSTILFSILSFYGIWKVYLLFCTFYPKIKGQLAVAFLFLPSVIFWGSGILKDTFSFSASCLFVYSFYMLFFKRKISATFLAFLALSALIIIYIKAYILMSLLPGLFIWLFSKRIDRINNKAVRVLVLPAAYLSIATLNYLFLDLTGEFIKDYKVEDILNKAVVKQRDLKQDYYGQNSFDIGNFEATIPSILSKTPIAIVSGIYRPFLWEASNIMMLLSALESSLLLFMTLYALFKTRVIKSIKLVRSSPLLLFLFFYSFLLAFSVGLTTANFGALARFKIPMLPFFLSALFIIVHENKKPRSKHG